MEIFTLILGLSFFYEAYIQFMQMEKTKPITKKSVTKTPGIIMVAQPTRVPKPFSYEAGKDARRQFEMRGLPFEPDWPLVKYKYVANNKEYYGEVGVHEFVHIGKEATQEFLENIQ